MKFKDVLTIKAARDVVDGLKAKSLEQMVDDTLSNRKKYFRKSPITKSVDYVWENKRKIKAASSAIAKEIERTLDQSGFWTSMSGLTIDVNIEIGNGEMAFQW